MISQKYKIYCSKCKKGKEMIIDKISRNRGVKLICLSCGERTSWHNFKILKKNE